MPEPVAVRIEPWGEDDLPLLQQLLGDPAMMEHLGGPESPQKIRERQARYVPADSGMYRIVDVPSGEAVGSVGYWPRGWAGAEVSEIGWSVLPAFQGRGIALAAAAQTIEVARAEGARRFLHAFPSVDNPPSNAICRALGFTLLGVSEVEYPPGIPSGSTIGGSTSAADVFSALAPSCAEPPIPALTPPAEAEAKVARALGMPVEMLPFPAGRRERESRGRRHERSTR